MVHCKMPLDGKSKCLNVFVEHRGFQGLVVVLHDMDQTIVGIECDMAFVAQAPGEVADTVEETEVSTNTEANSCAIIGKYSHRMFGKENILENKVKN